MKLETCVCSPSTKPDEKGHQVSILSRFRNRLERIGRTRRVLSLIDNTIGRWTRRKVDALAAMTSEAYISCELAKMRPIASLPVAVFRKRDGVREEVYHPLGTLLTRKWNPFTTAMQGLRWLLFRKDTYGTAYVRVEWRGGNPVALWQLNCHVEQLHDGDVPVFHVDGDDFTERGTYLAHEILVFKAAVSKNGFEGCSIMEIASHSLGLSIDIEEYYAAVLNNGSHFGGYLETDADLTLAEKREIAESLKGSSGILEAGKVRIFDKGLKYKQVQQTMGELNLIEQERWVLQRMCGVTSVPPQEVFELSNNTYSNAEQGAINFVQKTIVPEVADLERVFQQVLDDSGRPDCYVKFNVAGLLRGDFETQQRGYQIGVFTGYYTRADIRMWEDLKPIPGLEKPVIPVNYALIDSDGNAVTVGSESPADAMALLVNDAKQRISNRVRRDGDTEGTRKFALDALTPIANACALARVPFDIDQAIKEVFDADL